MSANERFTIKKYTNPSGQQVWRVQGRMPNGERIRQNFHDHATALAHQAELEIRAQNQPVAVGLKRTRLTDEQLAQAEAAFLKLDGGSLLAAVEQFKARGSHQVAAKLVKAALDEYMDEKRTKKKLRPRTLQDYKSRLLPLKTIYGAREVGMVLSADLEPLIFKPGQSAYTNNGNRRVLQGFFRWCKRKKYILTNPVEDIVRAQQDDTEPQILSLTEAKLLLWGAARHKEGKLLPSVVLGLFAGLRPEEIARLGWSHINLDQRVIRVTGTVAKLRSRRVIDIPENAVEWLRLCVGKPILPENWRRDFDILRQQAGYKGSRAMKGNEGLKEWPSDAIRHTAISYYLALSKDEHATAYRSGNSPEIIHSCYKGLVTPQEAEEFWSLKPDDPERKTIQLPLAA